MAVILVLFQIYRISPYFHDHSNVLRSSFVMVSANSLSTLGCVPSGNTGVVPVQFLKSGSLHSVDDSPLIMEGERLSVTPATQLAVDLNDIYLLLPAPFPGKTEEKTNLSTVCFTLTPVTLQSWLIFSRSHFAVSLGPTQESGKSLDLTSLGCLSVQDFSCILTPGKQQTSARDFVSCQQMSTLSLLQQGVSCC